MSARSVGLTLEQREELGAKLRRRRRIKRLSLAEVSRRSGISVGMLSQVERGLSSPSLTSLVAICETLEMPIGWVFDETHKPSSGAVVRKAERRRLNLQSTNGISKELLSPDQIHEIQMLRIVIRPTGGSGMAPYNNPSGAKCGYVLSGRLGLRISGADYELEEGDSFAFDAKEMHKFWCAGEQPTEILWIVTPAVY